MIALLSSIAVFSVALATGCGGSDSATAVAGAPISFQELARSASSSSDAASGRFAFDMTMSFPGAHEPFAFSGEGAFDAKSERASFSLDMSSLASLLGGLVAGMAGPNAAGAPDFDDPSAWKIEAVQDGTVSYVRFPALDEQLPDGKSWIRSDSRTAPGRGFDVTQFEQFTSNDPRELLDFLRGVSGEIETVGSEQLRGAQTTHHRATIDPLEYAKLVPPDKRQELQSLVEQIAAQSGLGEVPVDVWLDESGLVRKLTMAFSATQPGTSESSDVSMTFELYDYGETVDIDLPPASEV
ncbi:MAG: hypothetical protein ACRDPV_04410, partial [Gaiellaceae bacterium]